MDKDHKIWEMSDADFLNFLYQEREREYSKHSEWGVNFWVVGAAIVGLLGYAFNSISKNYQCFDWRLFVYYSTVIGALIICGLLLVRPFIRKNRWIHHHRITTVLSNAPIVFMVGKFVITLLSIIFLQYWHEYGTVLCLWLAFLFIEDGAIFYVIKNRKRFIKVSRKGEIFINKTIESCYRIIEGVICFAIFVVALVTWGWQYQFAEEEFEMSCVFAIILGVIWLVCYRCHDKRYRTVDWWIEQYIYMVI